MAAQPATTAVYLPHLAAELPPDWTASEGAGFLAPSGTVVRVRVDGAHQATADQVLDAHLASLTDEVGDVEVRGTSSCRALGSLDARRRAYAFRRGDRPMTGEIIATIVHDKAVVVTADWPTAEGAEPTEAGPEAIETVLRGLRLLERGRASSGEDPAPAPEGGATGQGADPPRQLRTLDPEAWASARSGWLEADLRADPFTDIRSWGREELAVLAAHVGGESFPTVDLDTLEALTAQERSAALTAVVGSLLARGLLEVQGETLEPAPDVRSLLRIATDAELTVHLDRSTRSTSDSYCYALRGDEALRIEVPNGLVRRTAAFPPDQLVARVVDDSLRRDEEIISQIGESDADRIAGRVVTIQEIIEDRAGICSFTRVRVGWWEGQVGVGGTFGWAVSNAGELLLAEMQGLSGGGSEAWKLTVAEPAAARACLVDHLPGGSTLAADG